MSFAQGGHLTALAEHHLEPLLSRQRRQVIQLKLDFHTLVIRACFQHRHQLCPNQLKPPSIIGVILPQNPHGQETWPSY
jgi:hypothetical protein